MSITSSYSASSSASAVASSSHQTGTGAHKKVAIVTGATGNVSPHIIAELKKKGFCVIACSRREHAQDDPQVTWLQTSGENISRKEFWDGVLAERASGADTVLVVSTIGAARAPEGTTLREVNRGMVIPIVTAAKDFARENPEAHVTATHVSSIAAQIIPDDDYGRVKMAVDEEIVAIGKGQETVREGEVEKVDNFHSIVFQPGYIFPGAERLPDGRWRVDDGHAWSMGQLVQLGGIPLTNKTIVPMIGSGRQNQQPIAATNLAQAIANASDRRFEDSEIVAAVGPDVETQASLVDFYARLAGLEAIKVPVKPELVIPLMEKFGIGRLQGGFAAKMMRAQDGLDGNRAFNPELLSKYLNPGERLISIRDNDKYPNPDDGAEIVMRSPPVGDQARYVAHVLKPVARDVLVSAVATAAIGGIGYLSHLRHAS